MWLQGLTLASNELDMMARACDPSTLEMEAERLGVRGRPQVHSKLEASLGSTRPHLKASKQKMIERDFSSHLSKLCERDKG